MRNLSTHNARKSAAALRLGLGCTALLASSTALAAPAGQDQAALHLNRGAEHYQAGRFDAAARELRLAYELNPLPRILCNIAQACRKGGHDKEALENYQLCLRTDPKLSAAERAEFQGHVAQLEKKFPPTPAAPIPVQGPDSSAAAAPGSAPPLYKRPWFWGLVGGLVAATAIGVGVGVGVGRARSGPTPPDGIPVFEF